MTNAMINGAHVVVYSTDAESDRTFFRDVLKFPAVDAGHGWLIFALPPAEAAFHPFREERPSRTVLHVRRPEDDNAIAKREKSEVRSGERGTLGQCNYVHAAWWGKGRAVSA